MIVRLFSLILLVLLGLNSCKQDSKLNDPKLLALEQEFEKNPSESNYDKLITNYLELMQSKQLDQESIRQILIKGATASEKINKKDQQIIFLNNLIKEYPDASENKDYLAKMVALLKESNKTQASDVLALSLKKAYPSDPKAIEIIISRPEITTPEAYILEIGKSIFSDTTKGFNEQNAMVYVDACEAYALALPKDPETPEYIFKAAETSNTLRTYDKSFALYDWVIERYPEHKRAPMCLFMKAFLFDGTLKDTANAKKYYQEFITKYPQNDFAKDARILLDNVGKSDEEVLENLMKKNK
ncbi:MAG: tetratricopeptide repeat protein [Bacteroidota bacterium]|nr:tetratricopeptide repeat protein [Bacteroidota bacterium]